MIRLIKNMFSVILTLIKFVLIKIIHPSFSFYLIERFSPNTELEFGRKSLIRLGKYISAHSGCKFRARDNAILDIGGNCKFNYNCIITAKKKILIGNNVECGPNVLIYDHDHDYKYKLKEKKFKCMEVVIGNNVWIGANTVILKGTKIGDNCVIGAGGVVKGVFESNSLIINNRVVKKI